MTRARTLFLVLTAMLLAGCVSSMLAGRLASPPNRSGIPPLFSDSAIITHAPEAFSEVWKVRVAAPAADIVVASIEPGDYTFQYDLRLSYPPDADPRIDHFTAFWRPAAEVTRPPGEPRGTVVLLHGYLQDKRYVTPWAIRLAQEGFRCAVVDLRGHGDSTGKHVSFGAFEAGDVSAVLDDLERRGWDVSRVGMLGVSYGASVALLAAGRDPRVQAVVAFEPFSDPRKAIPELMRAAFPRQARGISDAQFAAAHLRQAEIAGFDWRDADVTAALGRTRAPVLFLHGEADAWLSPDHSRALAALAPPGSRLRLVPHDNHVTLPLQIAPFEGDVLAWFASLSSR